MVTAPHAQPRPTRKFLGLEWPREVTPAERRSLTAGGLGWMLDAFDVMLLSMVLPYIMREFGIHEDRGGLLGLLTLGASAVGGAMFGFVADRVGRTRALMASILRLFAGEWGLRAFQHARAARHFPRHPRIGHGRRVDLRRRAHR